MLDDFGHELEMTDSKLQQTVLKVEKVLRLSDGKRLVFFFKFIQTVIAHDHPSATTIFLKPVVLLLFGG